MENNKQNDRSTELIFTLLFLLPIIGAIVYLLYLKPQKTKKIVAAVGIIPVANFVAFVILLLDYLNVLTLDKETIEINACTETNCGCEKVEVKEELKDGNVVKEKLYEEQKDAVFVPDSTYSSPSDVFDEGQINANPSIENTTKLTNENNNVKYENAVDFEIGNLKEE